MEDVLQADSREEAREMTVREEYQRIEEQILSSQATLSQNTRGRERPEEECPLRTPYQRDRDRIIHC